MKEKKGRTTNTALPLLRRRLDQLNTQIEIALKESDNLKTSIAEERRKHNRVYMMSSVALTLPGEPDIEACSLNISAGGICLYTLQFLPIETKVMIRLFYTDTEKEKVFEDLQGVVKWYRRIGKFYGIGIAFDHLDPVKHPILLSMVQSCEARE